MNQIILDCKVQKDVRLFDEVANFNVSSITGQYTLIDNTKKNRFTYIRVIYPHEVDDNIMDILQPESMIRIYGKLDSEQYKTSSNKIVYNKILVAEKIIKIKYDKDIEDYVEVD